MKQGFALITVLAVLILIAVGTATVLHSLGSQTDMKSNNLQDIKSQFLAEAGMQHALWRCRNGGCIDEVLMINDDVGANRVEIDVEEIPAGSNQFTIRVTADYANV